MEPEQVILEKSPNDDRDYCALQLENQIKMILIHDKTVQKSACSISVGVGSFQDPDNSLGLAHFLQHMIFMGSEKYPDYNSYSMFISNNCGEADAHTDDDQTNYFFQVKNSAFQQALQMFIDCFANPLLTNECIEKQVQAVHEEYILWSDDDESRKEEVFRKLGCEPYSRFSIGNKKTLFYPKVREDLRKFYNKWYSSNIINVVLCSNMSIQEMRQKIASKFEKIENKNVKKPVYQKHFKKNQLGKMIRINSIKDDSHIDFVWVLDSLREQYRDHVLDYIEYVLQKNPLISILQEEEYGTQIQTSVEHIQSQTLIRMKVELSEQGQENYERVYNIVMDFVESIEPDMNLYEEIRQIKKKEFQFKEKEDEIVDQVCDLSSLMHHISTPQVLNYTSSFNDFNYEKLKHYISQLTSQNLILVISTDETIKGMKEQKFLGAQYRVDGLPKRENANIKFPSIIKNHLLPIQTELFPNSCSSLQKLKDNVYFHDRGPFNVCKGGIKLNVHTNEDYVFKEFYSQYLETLLESELASGYSVNMDINIYSQEPFIIQLYGFNDSVCKIMNGIVQSFWKVHNDKDNKSLFDMVLDDFEGGYDNFYCDETDELAEEILDLVLVENNPSIKELKAIVEGYKFKDIKKRIKSFWRRAKFEWIVVGNFNKQDIINIVNKFEKQVKKGQSNEEQIQPYGCMKITENVQIQAHLSSEQMKTSGCIVYYQVGPYSEELFYQLCLLENYISQPFFIELRTEKKLAYHLQASLNYTRGVLGLHFLLISSTIDPCQIAREIKKFVKEYFGNLLENLTQEAYIKLKQALISQLCGPHPNLQDFYEFVVEEIQEKTMHFERKSKQFVSSYLQKISVKDLMKLCDEMLQKSLDVFIISKAHMKTYKKKKLSLVKKHEEVKKNAEYYPPR